MRFLGLALALLALSPSSRALAQRTIAQDTMSETTPVAMTCGFCAMEAYGVVFREVGTGGLTAADFPLTLRSFSVALGDADVSADGNTCTGRTVGGTALVHVEIWAGATPPTGDPVGFPVLGEPWAGEELVYAADDVPVTLSVPTTDGGTGFNLMLNTFDVVGEMGEPVVVAEGNSYLRVAVGLTSNGMHNAICVDPLESPGGFPVRDDEGRVGPERGFIYAGGFGWAWNEDLPGPGSINGDWGIRLSVLPMPSTHDAGPRLDAGAGGDASPVDASLDAASAADAGAPTTSGSCGCRMAGGRSPIAMGLLALVGLALMRRRSIRGARSTR
jgi:MYXO-CTERM domain-containing protein